MKTSCFLISFLLFTAFAGHAQDTLDVDDVIHSRHEGVYKGIITWDNKRDSLTIVTQYDTATFAYDELKVIYYNRDRERYRNSLLHRPLTPDERQALNRSNFILMPVTRGDVMSRRDAAIALSCLGFACHVSAATCLGIAGSRGSFFNFTDDSIDMVIAGSALVAGGFGFGFGSMGGWISCMKKQHMYKVQHAWQ